jgi:hypothetical protein
MVTTLKIGEQHADSARIDEELKRVLLSAPFRGSKQCQTLLRYLVENSLAQDDDRLKERTIGAEVFGRRPDYDTADDPIVRSRVAEVRKRLAQYLLTEESRSSPLQFVIPVGSYRATFVLQRGGNHETNTASGEHQPEMPPSHTGNGHHEDRDGSTFGGLLRTARSRMWAIVVASAVCALALLASLSITKWTRSEFDLFWAPVLEGKSTILIYTGTNPVYYPTGFWNSSNSGYQPNGHDLPATPDNRLDWSDAQAKQIEANDLKLVEDTFVTVGDLSANANVVALLTAHHCRFDLRSGSEAPFVDLQKSPTVLIGAFNNYWTLGVNQSLSFYFDRAHKIRENGGKGRVWSTVFGKDNKIVEDYAIVSRIFDSDSGMPLIAIGGLTTNGTRAAGEFVTNPAEFKKIGNLPRSAWNQKHLQFVLHSTFVNDVPSSMEVVALSYH